MVLDPAGLAIGVGGILLAFKGVVDAVNLFELIVAKDNGSKHLALRYYVERHKTVIWGDEFQPDNEAESPLLQESDATRRLVAGVLSEIHATHELARNFLERIKVKEVRDSQAQKNNFLWGVKDKDRFTEIIERLASLNTDLRELVHGQGSQSLAAAISASLLPQIRDSLSLVALQHTESIDPLLKLSARLKELQNASEQHEGVKASILNFRAFFKANLKCSTANRSVGSMFHGSSEAQQAWVDWRPVPMLSSTDQELVVSRIKTLSVMLAAARDPQFHMPPCLGLVEDTDDFSSPGRKLGFMFRPPENHTMADTGPKSLRDLFAEFVACPPFLDIRFKLACNLAAAVSLIHAAKWIHKGIRSESMLFFNTAEGNIDVSNPLLSGFEYSRPENQASLRDRVTGIPAVDIYYHPDVPLRGFNRVRDIYSLGVVLLEVAMWSPMEDMLKEAKKKDLAEMTMSEYRAFYVESLDQVGSAMGSSYREAVRVCLTGDFGISDYDDGSVLGRAFFTKSLDESPSGDQESLQYTELNIGAETTILLIHGAFSSGTEEWNKVTPHLSEYHLILPNLYQQGKGSPQSSSKTSAQRLATLIQRKAVHSKAHIIGFSLGAHVALRLIATYPSVIRTAFITGYNVFPNTNPTFMAYTFWLGGRIEGAVSKCLRRQRPGSHTPTLDEYREVTKMVCHKSWPSPWPARTLIIAAGKPGLFADHVEDAIKLQHLGRQSNLETVAYTHRELIHAWHYKKPETFAQTSKAWFEEGKVAEGFQKL